MILNKVPVVRVPLVRSKAVPVILPESITVVPSLKVLRVRLEEPKVSPAWIVSGAADLIKDEVGLLKFRS